MFSSGSQTTVTLLSIFTITQAVPTLLFNETTLDATLSSSTSLDISLATDQQTVDFDQDMDPVWWFDQISVVDKVCDEKWIKMPNGCSLKPRCHGVTHEITVALRDAVKKLAKEEIIASQYKAKVQYCKTSNSQGGCVQYDYKYAPHTKFANHLDIWLDQEPGDKWAGEFTYDITCKKNLQDCFACKAVNALAKAGSAIQPELSEIFLGANIIVQGACKVVGC